MKGSDVWREIEKLRDLRRNEMHRLMKDYDTEMNKKIGLLMDVCEHEEIERTNNGLGWIGTRCRFCGKQLTNEYVR